MVVERARSLIAANGFKLDAEALVGTLSPAGRQLVEICRAIALGSSLLIFDEPTSSLSEAETHEVFRIVRRFRERKAGIIYITHRLEELRSLGDRVTVLRDGATVFTGPLGGLKREELIQHMVGRSLSALTAAYRLNQVRLSCAWRGSAVGSCAMSPLSCAPAK